MVIVIAIVGAVAVAGCIAFAVSQATREATVRAAVESVVGAADQQLGQRADASARELSLHRNAIGEQLHEMGSDLRHLNDLVAVLQRDRAAQHGEHRIGTRQPRTRRASATWSGVPATALFSVFFHVLPGGIFGREYSLTVPGAASKLRRLRRGRRRDSPVPRWRNW